MLRRGRFASGISVTSSGGANLKRARSWVSVSRIKAVMSCDLSNAFVKILGGGNLLLRFSVR